VSALRTTVLAEIRSIRNKCDALEKLLLGSETQAQATSSAPDMSVPTPFLGIPIESKYSGKCVVCGNGNDVGDSVIYCAERKKCAHLGCGKPKPRGGRDA